jgi:hypothetical protein
LGAVALSEESLPNGVGNIAAKGFGPRGDEVGIKPAPDGEKRGCSLSKILLESGIQFDVVGVIEKKI